MEILLDGDGAEAFVANLEAYFALDATDTEQFLEGAKRVLAMQYAMEDMLVAVGKRPALNREQKAGRKRNPFYTPTLAKAGGKP